MIVRGFNQTYNDLLIDGFSLASTDINLGQSAAGGRQISMEVLPSNLASHIDVVKSALPSNDANFIGGLTNFVTASAFDFKRATLTASVKGGAALDSKGNGGKPFRRQAKLRGRRSSGRIASSDSICQRPIGSGRLTYPRSKPRHAQLVHRGGHADDALWRHGLCGAVAAALLQLSERA